MATKRDEKRAGVIEDENGNKISRTALNAQLVSVLFSSLILIWSKITKNIFLPQRLQ